MLCYRVLSALIMVPLIVGLVMLGGGWLLALVGVAMLLGSYEYAHLARCGGVQVSPVLVIGFTWLTLGVAYQELHTLLWPVMAVQALAGMVWSLVRYELGRPAAVTDWAFTMAGGLYLGGTAAHLLLVRNLTAGLGWTLLALGAAWLADSGAYLVGKAWGKHKLAPRLSPGKTWEGYLGGLLGSALIGVIWPGLAGLLRIELPPGLSHWHSLAVSLLVAALTPLGDLGESMLKRWAAVKDSGTLIPGHGGVLDRLDTLLWAAVIVYYYARWMI